MKIRLNKETKEMLMYGAAGAAFVWLVTRRPGTFGEPIHLWNTYYKLAAETDFGGSPSVALLDNGGNHIANITRAFYDDFCMEGSGKLRDGRVINFGSGSSYGQGCTARVLDSSRYPWGAGAYIPGESAARPLRPWKSIATDRHVIPLGSTVYIREFDGLYIPEVDGVGGFTHDGCFVAEDTGGAITGNHIDIFGGTNRSYRAVERMIPTRSRLTAWVNSARCRR